MRLACSRRSENMSLRLSLFPSLPTSLFSFLSLGSGPQWQCLTPWILQCVCHVVSHGQGGLTMTTIWHLPCVSNEFCYLAAELQV